jgi:glycosyltransferase involved in cell wall biosynthesis
MRIALITDTWQPFINGVVISLLATEQCLLKAGHQVLVVTAAPDKHFICPGFPDVPLAKQPFAGVARQLQEFAPEAIHIATEGPVGLAARRYCLLNGLQFNSAFHTNFAEYLWERSKIPSFLTYRWLRWFHGPSKAVLVSSARMSAQLQKKGFQHLAIWGRGVDCEKFAPDEIGRRACCQQDTLFLYVGRVAQEKNLDAFLRLDLPGKKWVVGDGPQRAQLEQRYPQVRFLGSRAHNELPAYFNCADVFVFPSKTDTFGLVMVEAMACGVPVAAFPVRGPLDVITPGVTGVMDVDLRRACLDALQLPRQQVREQALNFSWEAATAQFMQHLQPVRASIAPRMLRESALN